MVLDINSKLRKGYEKVIFDIFEMIKTLYQRELSIINS